MALSLSNPCVRPGIGKQGKALNVVSNFYQVTFKSITIHQYDIKFSPELDKRDWDKARPVSFHGVKNLMIDLAEVRGTVPASSMCSVRWTITCLLFSTFTVWSKLQRDYCSA